MPLLTRSTLVLALFVALSGCPAAGAARQAYSPFVIRPYLTDLAPHRAVLSWRQAEPGDASFRYEAEGSGVSTVAAAGNGPQHTVRLDGLLPGTRYLYEVNEVFRGTFDTPEASRGARFVAVGHTHGSEQFDQYPDRLLIARARELAPQFLIHTGDLTYTANIPDFTRYFFDEFADVISHVPIFISPGNHDSGWPFVHGTNLAAFRELFPYPYPSDIADGQVYYDVRWGDVHFFFLAYSAGLSPQSPQRQWVIAQLKQTNAAFKIVVFGGAQPSHYRRDDVLAAFAAAGADLVLNGDGIQPKSPIEWTAEGLPVMFVGTSGSHPHLLVYFEQENFYLTARTLDATGALERTDWFYSRRQFAPRIDLSKAHSEPIEGQDGLLLTHRFDPPISSNELEGLQLLQHGGQTERTFRAYVYLDPANLGPGNHGEHGFRTQYQSFSTRDPVVTVLFQPQDPLVGGAFEVEQIRLYLFGLEKLEDLDADSLYLF